MKRAILSLIFLLLLNSCSQNISNEPILKIHVSIKDKLPFEKFNYLPNINNKNEFYSVEIDVLNNTDSTICILTMSCSWQRNWTSNDEAFGLLSERECRANFVNFIEIQPRQKTTFNGTLFFNKPINDFKNKDFKLGFVLIRKQDVSNSHGSDFNEVLLDKLKNKRDIIWSDVIKFE